MKTHKSATDNNVCRKTPDETKKGLECCLNEKSVCPGSVCPYYKHGHWCGYYKDNDSLAYIIQLELYVSQVSKALCCKENATICEVLDAASQLKSRLAQAERERDAAINELPHHCWNCAYHRDDPIEEIDTGGRTIHRYCDADCCYPDEENSSWQWRGVCEENTKEMTMPSNQHGLYGKYTVIKNATGETVDDCFILRPNKDPVAQKALQTYADLTGNEQLANDLHKWIEEAAKHTKEG